METIILRKVTSSEHNYGGISDHDTLFKFLLEEELLRNLNDFKRIEKDLKTLKNQGEIDKEEQKGAALALDVLREKIKALTELLEIKEGEVKELLVSDS